MTLQLENNTLKGIGVSVPLIDQKPLSSFSNPNEMVADLLKQLPTSYNCSSKLKQWLQFIAHENLNKKYPTSEDIRKYFKCSQSHVKHRIAELKSKGIIEIYQEKKDDMSKSSYPISL